MVIMIITLLSVENFATPLDPSLDNSAWPFYLVCLLLFCLSKKLYMSKNYLKGSDHSEFFILAMYKI